MPAETPVPMGAHQERKLHVSLYELLAEASLGGIRLGMTRAAVLARAGHPAEFHRGATLEEAESWINGKVTFWFEGQTLARIGVYYVLDYLVNNAIGYDAAFPEKGATVASLRAFMERHAIGFREARGPSLVTSNGVAIFAGHADELLSMVVPSPD